MVRGGLSVLTSGSISYQTTIGNSNYNSLEASLRHTSRRIEFFVSYTYSESIDQSSNFGDQVNPFDPRPQPRTVLLRYEAGFCRELHLQDPLRTSLSRRQSVDGGLVGLWNHSLQH